MTQEFFFRQLVEGKRQADCVLFLRRKRTAKCHPILRTKPTLGSLPSNVDSSVFSCGACVI